MTDKLEDTSLRLKDEMDLYKKMMDKLRQNRQQFQKEKEEMQEVGGTFFFFLFTFCLPSVIDTVCSSPRLVFILHFLAAPANAALAQRCPSCAICV